MATAEQLPSERRGAPTHRKRYPRITAIDGATYRVDECGLLDVCRQWPEGDAPKEAEISLAIRWFARQGMIKTPSICSYSAKHAVERWLRLRGKGAYVSNGALIVAADRCGFRQEVSGHSLNTDVAISRRVYDRLPESAKQWNRMRVQP